jgi:hypothetical protein
MLDDPLNIPFPSGAVQRGRDSLASDVLARRARFVGRHGDGRRSRLGWSNGTLHTTEQERFDLEFERIARPALTITVRCRCDIRRPPTSIVH